MNDEVMVVMVTAGSEAEADQLARVLVGERLAACVNLVAPIRSIYRWKGELCDDREVLMIIKTRSSRFDALDRRVRQLHSYEVAEVIGWPVTRGAPDYLKWVADQTGGSSD
ncbi:MAG: divalent-cation tolerance protein CutA [Syntrophobacteraceae bacterium CG07_land_8_20_14_0_80_61_8]|nr:MAG: divalent-cation tolerance protein CutA [Syntrophobacteraceae bacterium CG07_land_8_20_14_0_80_61_8]